MTARHRLTLAPRIAGVSVVMVLTLVPVLVRASTCSRCEEAGGAQREIIEALFADEASRPSRADR